MKHQMMMLFHVDDLLTYHKYSFIVTKYVKILDAKHGKNNLLTVTQVLMHECIGITVNFILKRVCAISQYNYVKKTWKKLPKS